MDEDVDALDVAINAIDAELEAMESLPDSIAAYVVDQLRIEHGFSIL